MLATLPDRVVLVKQDSAKVAHVDVRVALSKSLPESSEESAEICCATDQQQWGRPRLQH